LPGALRQRLYNYQRLRVFYDSVTFAFRLTAKISTGSQFISVPSVPKEIKKDPVKGLLG